MKSGDCKPSGSLYFMLKDNPIMGSVTYYHTTSYQSIMRIQSSILQILQTTGGRLRGIPLKMVLRPGKVTYEEKNQTKSSTAYFVNIEFRHDDFARLVPMLLEQSITYERSVLTGQNRLDQTRLLAAGSIEDDDAVTIEDQSEADLAKDMTAEFYPNNRQPSSTPAPDTTATDDTRAIDGICASLGLNPAQKAMIFETFQGDIGASLKWITAFAEGIKPHQLIPARVHELFSQCILRPDHLDKMIASLAGGTPSGGNGNKGGRGRARTAAAADDKKPDPPAPTVQTATEPELAQQADPAGAAGGWGF